MSIRVVSLERIQTEPQFSLRRGRFFLAERRLHRPSSAANKQAKGGDEMVKPTDEQIRKRAQEIWEENHRPTGRDDEFWLQAEKELNEGLAHEPTVLMEPVHVHRVGLDQENQVCKKPPKNPLKVMFPFAIRRRRWV
jgi:hypothetical protein